MSLFTLHLSAANLYRIDLLEYFNGHTTDAAHQYQVRINSLSDLREKLAEQNDIELTQSSNDSSNNEQTLLTSPVANGERKRRSIFNAVTESTQNIRSSTNSLTKAPVYAKIIKSESGVLLPLSLEFSNSSRSSSYVQTEQWRDEHH